MTIDLKAGTERATVWTNDLTHAYVHENSAYSLMSDDSSAGEFDTSKPDQAKARTLAAALPWLKRYHGKIVVVKYGGNAMTDDDAQAGVRRGHRVPPVRRVPAGRSCTAAARRSPRCSTSSGIESEFQGGLRVTTPEAMDVVRMVLVGQVQRELVGLAGHDVVFLGLPHGQSAEVAAQLPEDTVVIDCGADFRLDDAGGVGAVLRRHPRRHLALRPARASRPARRCCRGATRIAVPGCYPTVSTLTLAARRRRGAGRARHRRRRRVRHQRRRQGCQAAPARQRGDGQRQRRTASAGPPAHPRDHPEPLAGDRRRRSRSASPRCWCRCPAASWPPARAPLAGDVDRRRRARGATSRPTPTSRSCTCSRRASGRRPSRCSAPTPSTSR